MALAIPWQSLELATPPSTPTVASILAADTMSAEVAIGLLQQIEQAYLSMRTGWSWHGVVHATGYRVYPPWRLYEWWYADETYAPVVFEESGAIAAGGGVTGARMAERLRHLSPIAIDRWPASTAPARVL